MPFRFLPPVSSETGMSSLELRIFESLPQGTAGRTSRIKTRISLTYRKRQSLTDHSPRTLTFRNVQFDSGVKHSRHRSAS
jgi:hypothetical protein